MSELPSQVHFPAWLRALKRCEARRRSMQSRVVLLLLLGGALLAQDGGTSRIGREVAIERHLQDDEEFQIGIPDLIEFGRKLFTANWTVQEGGGRPLSKGTGDPLSDLTAPLVFPRNFNRVSAPEANSCAGCHNVPFVGGGGDFVLSRLRLEARHRWDGSLRCGDKPHDPR